MKIYLVGGAVRDELLGVKSKDRDYVVVGSTHEEMMSLGFGMPVGAKFPVYLHPETKEEYALARTESSTGDGHKDFDIHFGPEVTIEEDLARRDLTINAIAKDLETGEYIDPYGGIRDIQKGILRNVAATAMREDPLRIYRLARFLARFGGKFVVDHSTMFLAECAKATLASLPKERKVMEIKKCFDDHSWDNKPSLMIDMLCKLGEMPEVDKLRGVLQPIDHHPEGDAFVHTMLCLDHAQRVMAKPETKWAVLCHDLGKVCYWETGKLHGHEAFGVPIAKEMSLRFGVPNSWLNLALVVTEQHTKMHRVFELTPRKVYDLMVSVRAIKDTEFALNFMEACLCDQRGRGPDKLSELYDQSHILWCGVVELNRFRREVGEKSKSISERLSGRPQLVAEEIRALKISYVSRALTRTKSEIKKLREEEGFKDVNLPTWRIY